MEIETTLIWRVRIRNQHDGNGPRARLDRETLETIDLFVKTGLYRNRSEAIRELMKRGLSSQEVLRSLGRIVKLIGKLDSAGKLNFTGLSLDREAR